MILFKNLYFKEVPSLFFLLLFLTSLDLFSQDLENIGKGKPIKVSGSVGTTQTLYGVSGIQNRRPPYLWFLAGNLNVDIYGVSIPISGFWSNQTREFRQPFNQYGLSPRYKWATAHLGYRNLSFSPYTLSGHTFLGVGVELNPGIWRIAAMYGRLNKAVAEDTLNPHNDIPTFKRMGAGFKVGIGKDGDFIDLILFKAKDDLKSLPYVPVETPVLPAENLVIGVNAQKRIFKSLTFSFEYATSAITRDIRAPKGGAKSSKNIFDLTGSLYEQRASSQYNNAFRGSIMYQSKFYGLQVGYERIEPEYRTLGAYFFNNDLENYTISPSLRIFEQRLNLNVSAGIQRNNILNNNFNSTKRILTSVNLSFAPNAKWNFGAQYSNFTTYNKISRRFDQFQTLDTLNFFQVNESASFNTGYNTNGNDTRHGVNLNIAFQRANETYGEQITNNDAFFYNGNVGYRITFVPTSLSISSGFNTNRNSIGGVNTLALGPMVSASKVFLDKTLRTSLTTSLNNILTEGTSTGRAINLSFHAGYTYLKVNNFSMYIIVLNKYSKRSKAKEFTEYTGTIAYTYSF